MPASDAPPPPLVLWRDRPHYEDVYQGYLGNCYMLAAMAALADKRPERIEDAFRDNELVRDGDRSTAVHETFVVVRLYLGGQLVRVAVDDYIPVSRHEMLPVFAGMGASGVAWPMLIEKAIAKVHGTFKNLEVGDPGAAMIMLSQSPVLVYHPPFSVEVYRAWPTVPATTVFRDHACALLGRNDSTGVLEIWEQQDSLLEEMPAEKALMMHFAMLHGGEVVSVLPVEVNRVVHFAFEVNTSANPTFWLNFDGPARRLQRYGGCGVGDMLLNISLRSSVRASLSYVYNSQVRANVRVANEEAVDGIGRFVVMLDARVSRETPWVKRIWVTSQAQEPLEMREVDASSALDSGFNESFNLFVNLSRLFPQTKSDAECASTMERLDRLNNAEELRSGRGDSIFPPDIRRTVCMRLRCVRLSPRWRRIRDLAVKQGKGAAGIVHHRLA